MKQVLLVLSVQIVKKFSFSNPASPSASFEVSCVVNKRRGESAYVWLLCEDELKHFFPTNLPTHPALNNYLALLYSWRIAIAASNPCRVVNDNANHRVPSSDPSNQCYRIGTDFPSAEIVYSLFLYLLYITKNLPWQRVVQTAAVLHLSKVFFFFS